MDGAHHPLHVVADLAAGRLGAAVLDALLADHQQAGVVVQAFQGLHQVAVALAQHRVRHAVGGHPGTRRFQGGLALFQGQPVALGVQVRQFGQQGLPGAQAQVTAEVGLAGAFCSRVSGLVQNVQQHQRCVEAAGGPGSVVANRVRGGGAVDTGNHMTH